MGSKGGVLVHAGRLAGIRCLRGRDCNVSQKRTFTGSSCKHTHTSPLMLFRTIQSFTQSWSETSGHLRADRLSRDSQQSHDLLRSSDQLPHTHTHTFEHLLRDELSREEICGSSQAPDLSSQSQRSAHISTGNKPRHFTLLLIHLSPTLLASLYFQTYSR